MSNCESIFISYRRKDSFPATWRIYDQLANRFGKDNVFIDENNIPCATKFKPTIAQALENCELTLVVIGPEWATITENGIKRLDNPEDDVRIEVETSLARNIPIIPVLIDDTTIPKKSDLPKSMRNLVDWNAIRIRQGSLFNQSIQKLKEIIWEQILGRRQEFIARSKYSSSYNFPYLEYVQAEVSIFQRTICRAFGVEIHKHAEEHSLSVQQITWNLNDEGEHLDLIKIPSRSRVVSNSGNLFGKFRGVVEIEPPIKSFYIGKYPITQLQWRIISKFSEGELNSDPSCFKENDKPVESITWHEANRFCEVLSMLTNCHFRLPSKAEWQHACRAETTGSSPYGLGHDQVNMVSSEHACQSSKQESTHRLFDRKGVDAPFWPNSFGLYHMLGNVSEWCSDNRYVMSSRELSDRSEYERTKVLNSRVVCGGSFKHPKIRLGTCTFDGEDSNFSLEYVGLRIVMEVK